MSKQPPWGWSGGALVLGKLPVPGRPTIWKAVGQGPTALAVGAGGGCLDIFTLIYPFSPLSPSLWETARYRLKYCLKGPLNPRQPTKQPPPAPSASAVGPCPTVIQSVGRLGTGSLSSTIAPPNRPRGMAGSHHPTAPGGSRVVRWSWGNFQCRGVLQF